MSKKTSAKRKPMLTSVPIPATTSGDETATTAARANRSVHHAAEELRRLIFSAEPGEFLGEEEVLLRKLGVGRPTFRLAAMLVEQEQLLTVRKGFGGGYFARRPDITGVAHMAAMYLRSQQFTETHILETYSALYAMMARHAAEQRNRDVEAENRLALFVKEEQAALREPLDWDQFSHRQLHLNALLADLSRNPLMKLYLDTTTAIHYFFYADKHPLREGFEHIMGSRLTRYKVCQAVLHHEPEIAEMLAHRWKFEVGVYQYQLNAKGKDEPAGV